MVKLEIVWRIGNYTGVNGKEGEISEILER
jgi:hypothetical protein